MSTNVSDALNAVVGTNQAAQAATDTYSQAAQSVVNQANDTLTQATQETKNLQVGERDKANATLQAAQTASSQSARDEAVQSFIYGQQALGPDVKQQIDDFHNQLQQFHEDQGGFLNQFALGMTGRDYARSNLQAHAEALQTLQTNLGELASRASADIQLQKQLTDAATLPRQAAAQGKIDQATAYLEHAVPAIDNAQKIKVRAAGDVSAAAGQKATEAKNMYMTILSGNREQKENQNADLQRQILSLNIEEKQNQLKEAMQDTQFKNDLSARTGVPVPLLEKQPIQTITDIANAASGLPVVNNLDDPKEIERAKQASYVLSDPYQNVTAKTLGDELLKFQQDQFLQSQQLLPGAKAKDFKKNPNYSLVADMRNDFLDNATMQFPGKDHTPTTLPNALAKWYLDPLNKGQVFWNSPETQAYITSGTPGATLAQRVQNDIGANPGALQNGVSLNYLAGVGGNPDSIYDFYNYIRNRVVTSTPFQLYGLAPPQAKIGMRLDTQSVGVFGDVNPQTQMVVPQSPEDVNTALIQLNASKRAAAALAKLKISGDSGFPGSIKAN